MNASASSTRWLTLSVLIAASIVAGYWSFTKLLGVCTVEAGIETDVTDFGYRAWDAALRDWVIDGRVDYRRLVSEQARLRRFVAQVGSLGPHSKPERFLTDAERLAYYINAYNALVLLGVLEHWPIESVQDVHGPIEPRPGFGFFYALWFELDQRLVNLYNLEHQVLRGFRDARIHAAINCASISCPPLQPFAYNPQTLDSQLDRVTREFCSQTEHVRVDDAANTVELSSIFDWYEKDFIEHAALIGVDQSVFGFIEAFATEAVSQAIRRAREHGYETWYMSYDWRLNRM